MKSFTRCCLKKETFHSQLSSITWFNCATHACLTASQSHLTTLSKCDNDEMRYRPDGLWTWLDRPATDVRSKCLLKRASPASTALQAHTGPMLICIRAPNTCFIFFSLFSLSIVELQVSFRAALLHRCLLVVYNYFVFLLCFSVVFFFCSFCVFVHARTSFHRGRHCVSSSVS